MPTPERTTLQGIVATARSILETEGLARVTMQAVADRVGVRAPSLYKRVKNREALLGLVAASAVNDLGERLELVGSRPSDARTQLAALARVLRSFAHAHPAAFHLVFAGSEATRPDPALLAAVSRPLLLVAAELAGEDNALEAARTVTAWTNGFISMELAGAFKLGGDVERAFEFGIDRIADALAIR